MRYRVVVMPSAEKDIVEAIRYISNNLQNKKAANEHYLAFNDGLRTLESMPERNPISSLDFLTERNLRLLPIGNYAAVYRVFDDEKRVEVYRILYAKMDLEERIGADNELRRSRPSVKIHIIPKRL